MEENLWLVISPSSSLWCRKAGRIIGKEGVRAEMGIEDRCKGTQLTGLRILKPITVPGLALKNEELGIPLSLAVLTS